MAPGGIEQRAVRPAQRDDHFFALFRSFLDFFKFKILELSTSCHRVTVRKWRKSKIQTKYKTHYLFQHN